MSGKVIKVPDIPHPTLCWKQDLEGVGVLMGRCNFKKHHKGKHAWELLKKPQRVKR